MKKITLILCIIFIIMTFAGAGYVLFNHGRINAGYAVVSMAFSIASILCYRQQK